MAGGSGYAGGELLRLVSAHPELEVAAVAAGASAGSPVSASHPQLVSLADRLFVRTDPQVLADADLVVLALPHGESAGVVAALPPDIPVVDLGGDYRLADAATFSRFYGGIEHAGHWPYGMPELPGQRDRLRGSIRIASPGCYPTAVILSLAPLLAAELVEPTDIVVVAASGSSGAGRKPSASMLATEVMGSVFAYKYGGVHQHTPEMEQALSVVSGQQVGILFTPLLVPMPRGILATTTTRTVPGVTEDTLRDALHAAYDLEPFVHVLPAHQRPTTAATLGSNSVHLQVALDPHSGRTTVIAAIDNLVKGAAGQGIQNVNLILGLPETLGLPADGVAP